MEVDEPSNGERSRRRKSPHSAGRGIVLNKPLGARIGEGSNQQQGYAPSRMMLSTRRSSSGIFITTMFGARFRHLQKLHSDAFTLGLNGVCFPGLPIGTMFRSSLPATPVSTPIHREFHHFTEQAIRERLCRTPSPRKNRGFGPLSLIASDPSNPPGDGLNSFNVSNCSEIDGIQPMDLATPTTPTPIAEAIEECSSCEATSDSQNENGSQMDDQKEPSQSQQSQRKLFIGNLNYRTEKRDLCSFFKKFGGIDDCVIVRDHIKKMSKGFGFVTFYSSKSAEKVLNADPEELMMDGRQLRVNYAQPKTIKEMKRDIYEKKRESDEAFAEREQTVQHLVENKIVRKPVVVSTRNMSNINDFDDDILLLIFSKIDNLIDKTFCERVCKRWMELVRRSWHSQQSLELANTFFSFDAPLLTSKVLCDILKKCPSLKHLNLEAVSNNLDTSACELIAACCPLLENINVSKASITLYGLKVLSEKCTSLKEVNISYSSSINEKALWSLVKNAANLEVLQVEQNFKITGVCFHNAKQLKKLNIAHCPKVTSKGFDELSKAAKNLEHLKIGPIDVNIHRLICSSFTELKHLEIVSAVEGEPSGFQFIHRLHNLEVLKIHPSYNDLDDNNFVTLLKSCRKLKVLEVHFANNLTDDSAKELANLTTDLRELILKNSKIGDTSVFAISCSLSSIRKLEIEFCNVTDASLKSLLENCGELQVLNVNNCEEVTLSLLNFAFDMFQANRIQKSLGIELYNKRIFPKNFKNKKEIENLVFDDDDYFYNEEYRENEFPEDEQDELNDFLTAEDPVEEYEREFMS